MGGSDQDCDSGDEGTTRRDMKRQRKDHHTLWIEDLSEQTIWLFGDFILFFM